MGSMVLRTFQVVLATIVIALAMVGIMWVLGLIEPAAAKASAYRIGGVLGICLVAALAMFAVFSVGRKGDAE